MGGEMTVTEHRNEVLIVGRVSARAEDRVLPSGDEITTWRVVVDRGQATPGHDTLDCTAWTSRLRRSAASWDKGDVVEVEGALRRRHWRTPAGTPASGYTIEVSRARRLTRPRKPE
jgi:single-strand DNA-binding protein